MHKNALIITWFNIKSCYYVVLYLFWIILPWLVLTAFTVLSHYILTSETTFLIKRSQKFAKFADGRGVGVKKVWKFADVLNGWSLGIIQDQVVQYLWHWRLLCRSKTVSKLIFAVCSAWRSINFKGTFWYHRLDHKN